MTRLVVNDIPARLINQAYDLYSSITDGQMAVGLPVPAKLVASWEEIERRAVAKLALVLYHIYVRAAGVRIAREKIKHELIRALDEKQIRLTENVILLTRPQLRRLTVDALGIDRYSLSAVFEEALRRSILHEALRQQRRSGYFESRIEENDETGRGDYETVYYRDYTDEGKEIGFRRLASMEAVQPGDHRPALLLVPGFANSSRCFNLNNRFSIAKDLADWGSWVYLFDPRGMGINEGRFDPYYTVDTLIDTDLPTVISAISDHSHGKPAVLIGHSMGGMVTENMVLNCTLRCRLDRIDELSDAQKEALKRVLPEISKARAILTMVRGIINLGTPKFFDKFSHVFFPSALWLNHLSRIFGFKQVPIQQAARTLTQLPLVRTATSWALNADMGQLNILINPANHQHSRSFVETYLQRAMESVPLGMGFQFLKAIYNGEGFKRMDASRLNYSLLTPYLPADLPIFHIWGEKDRLAPPPSGGAKSRYPHRWQRSYRIASPADIESIRFPRQRGLKLDFYIAEAGHLDLLYGKAAELLVYPLLKRLVAAAWDNWDYPSK